MPAKLDLAVSAMPSHRGHWPSWICKGLCACAGRMRMLQPLLRGIQSTHRQLLPLNPYIPYPPNPYFVPLTPPFFLTFPLPPSPLYNLPEAPLLPPPSLPNVCAQKPLGGTHASCRLGVQAAAGCRPCRRCRPSSSLSRSAPERTGCTSQQVGVWDTGTTHPARQAGPPSPQPASASK